MDNWDGWETHADGSVDFAEINIEKKIILEVNETAFFLSAISMKRLYDFVGNVRQSQA